MKIKAALLSGLAGATTLTILNETIKRLDKTAPRLDLLGKNTIAKGLESLHLAHRNRRPSYLLSLLTDLIGNTLYYSMAGLGGKKTRVSKGVMLGLSAGIAATSAPKQMGIEDDSVNRSPETTAKTIAYYVLAGLATSLVMKYTEERLVKGWSRKR